MTNKILSSCKPPHLANRLLKWALKPDLLEEILGDLEEKYEQQLKQKSPLKAKANYWYETLNYLRPFAIRNNLITDLNPFFMWQHHFKLAFRNSIRDKSTFFINLIGLSTGLACTILIALWVWDEVQIDKFHTKKDRLYQALIHHDNTTNVITTESTQGLLAEALRTDMPEVEAAVQASELIPQPFVFGTADKKVKGVGQLVEPDFFTLFDYPLLEGDRSTLLQDQQSLVVSDEFALKMFNTTDVVGKMVSWEVLYFNGEARIDGVVKTMGQQSSRQFDFLMPFALYKQWLGDGIHWGNFNSHTYVLLKENANVVALNERLPAYIQEKADWDKISLELASFTDRYLYSTYENGQQAGGRIQYVRLFSIIAFFILAIACINFMNLSTAKATRKLKEVGVRKTIGAERSTLIGQYLGESIFMSFAALLTALLFVQLLLPQFNFITGKSLTFPWNVSMTLSLLGITLFTGLLAGSYPAFYLSGFQPIKVLKGVVDGATGAGWLRRVLVVFQFALSIILIVSVLVVYQQISFIQNKNLGYDKENIISFPKEGMAERNIETFLTQLKDIPGISNASAAQFSVADGGGFTTGVNWEGKNPEETIRFATINVYYDLLETMGIPIKEGRSFSREFGAEKNNIILNETAVSTIGLTDPIGKTFELWGNTVTVVGVTKDVHLESLHEAISPTFFMLDPEFLLTVMARIEKGREREVVQS
ncbi:MAG: ABC transporter permease, partial [Bacteroidota bacterium]